MQEYFYQLADELTGARSGAEVLLMNFSGEQSDFVRFNHSAIRQAGAVSQAYLRLELILGQRHASQTVTICGELDTDRRRLSQAMSELRENLPHLPEDPYLLYATEVHSGEHCAENRLPDVQAPTDAIVRAGQGRDLVGIYAQGTILRGFANSLGQRNWFATHSFHLDWSFYLQLDKAVKSNYAGFAWDSGEFERKMNSAGEQLTILVRPAKTIPPGQYRVYLTPGAMAEFAGLLGWDGYSLKAHRTRTTPLLRLITGEASLSPAVTICENTREGIAPSFQSAGFIKPEKVTLIQAGRCSDTLASPRSAKEYGLPTNGASEAESPESVDLAGGDIPVDQAVQRLGTGVYVNQLWYLNYSDRPAGRITGMTRFATFWVENGRIEAPVNVMRFDETVYRVLGENLLGLTAQRDFIPDASTYGSRSTNSSRLPGALVDKFNFTL